MTISDELRQILVDQIGCSAGEVLDESIIEDLGGDSLDRIEMMITVEVDFDIEVPRDKWNECKTFAQFCAVVEDAVKGKAA